MANSEINIKQLKFPENVRERPGMYIGTTENPDVIYREPVDNSVDEMIGGYCDTTLMFNNDKRKIPCIIMDNGRGIPLKEAIDQVRDASGTVTEVPLGITQMELAVGTLHAGSKFNKTEISAGTNGVGVSATNALSSDFYIFSKMSLHQLSKCPDEVKNSIKAYKMPDRDDLYYGIHYQKGYIVDKKFYHLSEVLTLLELKDKDLNGISPSTITAFCPDSTVFESVKCTIPTNYRFIKYMFKKTKNKDLKFFINGKEDKDTIKGFDNDLQVRINNPRKDSMNPYLDFILSIGLSEKLNDEEVIGSVNGLETNAGLHIKIVNKAYTNAFETIFGDVSGYACKGVNFLVIMLCNEPSFSSQTKERLSDIREFDLSRLPDLEKAFKKLINDNLDYFKQNYDRITEYLHSIDKLGKLGEIRKNVLLASQNNRIGSYQSKKLKDCTTTERDKAELFIVEGDSAAGSLLPFRDIKYHAILPLTSALVEVKPIEFGENPHTSDRS
jgi:DNA gyrase subunit B